jgi:hypothetical protein
VILPGRWSRPFGVRLHQRCGRWAAALLLLAGCGRETAERDAPPEQPPIPVVMNASPPSGPAWTFGGEPLVSIGGTDLVHVTGAVRVGNRIVVADAGARQLTVHGPDGRLLDTAGRGGRGPGEFQYIAWAGVLAPDSVAVWDPLLRRLSVFTADGTYVRDVSPSAAAGGGTPWVHGAFADGSLLLVLPSSAAGSPAARVWRDTATHMRISRTGRLLSTLGRFPEAEQFQAPAGEAGVFRAMALPFGKNAPVAVHGNRFYVNTGETYDIVVHDGDGAARYIIRRAWQPLPFTAADAGDYRRLVLSATTNPAARQSQQAMLDATPFPRTVAPLDALVPDAEGRLWAEDAQAPAGLARDSRWSVFDADGRWIARAEGPPRFTVFQIGPDWVLGRYTDEDMVEHVRLYALRRR